MQNPVACATARNKGFRQIYLLLFTVTILWGINVVMIKYLIGYFPPTALAAIRLSVAAAFLLPAVMRSYRNIWIPRQAWLTITGVAMFSIVLHQLPLSWGLAMTSGTHTVLILALNPLFTTLLASRLVNEPLTWGKTLGIVLGLTGILLIVSNQDQTSASTLKGDFLIVVAMLTYVAGSLLVKKSTALIPALVVTAYSHAIASVALIVIALVSDTHWTASQPLGFWPVAILLFSGCINTGLGALWWNQGIHKIGASTASLFLNIVPVAGMFASVLFLGEHLEWRHFAALILVLAGVSLGTGVLQGPQKAISSSD